MMYAIEAADVARRMTDFWIRGKIAERISIGRVIGPANSPHRSRAVARLFWLTCVYFNDTVATQ